MGVVQTVSTRNQSTANYSDDCIFLFDNRFQEETLAVTGTNTILQQGLLIVGGAKVGIATAANLADIVGILKMEDPMTVPTAQDVTVNICISGQVDQTGLVLPATVTLNTLVGNKKLKHILTGLGFDLKNVTEHSDFA